LPVLPVLDLCKAVGARIAHPNLYSIAAKSEQRVRILLVPDERSTKRGASIAIFSNDCGIFTIP